MGKRFVIIKGIIDEDFANYKKASMFIAFPSCSFKCDRECGREVCQNGSLAHSPDIIISEDDIIKRYLANPITSAVVLGGLEPFDSVKNLLKIVDLFRQSTDDDIVIYTGYMKDEIDSSVKLLAKYKNIIIKFGRFIPDQESHFDEVLGVRLASDNQYAERITLWD